MYTLLVSRKKFARKRTGQIIIVLLAEFLRVLLQFRRFCAQQIIASKKSVRVQNARAFFHTNRFLTPGRYTENIAI